MKKYLLLLLLSLTLMLTSCSNPDEISEPPKLTITSGGNQVQCNVTKTDWKGTNDTIEYIFQNTLKPENDYIVEKFSLGSCFLFSFEDDKIPDSCVLRDTFISKTGYNKYKAVPQEDVIYKVSGQKFLHILKDNPVVLYSTNPEDYEDGGIYRGFELECTWEDKTCVYTYIIRTDAAV